MKRYDHKYYYGLTDFKKIMPHKNVKWADSRYRNNSSNSIMIDVDVFYSEIYRSLFETI